MKLIKVFDGVYRTDNGIHVFRNYGRDRHEFKYTVTWIDWLSTKIVRKFNTLAEVKAYINR